jgi:hypothetical protein
MEQGKPESTDLRSVGPESRLLVIKLDGFSVEVNGSLPVVNCKGLVALVLELDRLLLGRRHLCSLLRWARRCVWCRGRYLGRTKRVNMRKARGDIWERE